MGQFFQAVRGQVAHRVDAQLLQPRLRHLAHSRHFAHRQRLQKFQHLRGPDDELPVGLVPVRGNLGQEFVGRDAGRRGQAGFFADLMADDLSHFGRRGQPAFVMRHVQIGFVQRQRFDQVGMAAEYLTDLARHLAIAVEVRRHVDGLRAQAFGADGGHGRMNAEAPRLVGRRANNRARPGPGHHHGLAAQVGIVALLHGRVERVHVHMHDLAQEFRHSSEDDAPVAVARWRALQKNIL